MKKLLSVTLMTLFALSVVLPVALADEMEMPKGHAGVADGHGIAENLNRGAQEADWSWTEVMQHSGEEASKGVNAQEHLTGAFAGGVIGVRKGLHRLGAGAIDLLTFWIPNKEPLIDPNDPTLR